MKSTNRGWGLCTVTAMSMLLFLWDWGIAGEFKADLIRQDSGQVKSGRIYVKGAWYRMEQKDGGEQFFVIVNQEAGTVRVLNSAKKMYRELSTSDPATLMNDPFQGVKHAASRYGSKLSGTEVVNGYQCDIYLISLEGRTLMTQWFSQKLQFPLKIINHAERDTFVELRNLQEGPVAQVLFQIPAGFTKMKEEKVAEIPPVPATMAQIPLPAWAAEVNSAQIANVPFHRRMSGGEMVRMKVPADAGLKVEAENEIEGLSAFQAIPFLNGKPVEDPAISTRQVTTRGQAHRVVRLETPDQADEVVIRILEGKLTVEVERTSR
jgi:hypothetical protein